MYIICVKLNSQQTCISLNARVYNCIFRRDQSFFQMYLKTFNIHKVSIKIKEQIFFLAFSTMITMKMLKNMSDLPRCKLCQKKTTKIAKTSQNKSCQVKSLKTCKFSDECNLLSCESEGCDVVDNVQLTSNLTTHQNQSNETIYILETEVI